MECSVCCFLLKGSVGKDGENLLQQKERCDKMIFLASHPWLTSERFTSCHYNYLKSYFFVLFFPIYFPSQFIKMSQLTEGVGQSSTSAKKGYTITYMQVRALLQSADYEDNKAKASLS